MYRRQLLSLFPVVGLGGCSGIPQLGLSSESLGETVEFGHLQITATDAMTTQNLKTVSTTSTGNNIQSHTAPSNGVFALFYLEVDNTDVAEQNAPAVNTANYDTLVEEPNTIYTMGVNDVRIYGESEGGHLPEPRFGNFLRYDKLRVNNSTLAAYEAGVGAIGPSIAPSGTVSGWTFAIIPRDKSPRLKINFRGQESTWEAGSGLSTPTPAPETINM